MPQPVLAEVFLQPSRSIIVHTTPGRDVKFYGGHARVVDHRDMPHMLMREDARVIPTAWACSWADQWLSNTPELKAQVEWPEGWKVEFKTKDDFTIYKVEGDTISVLPANPEVSVETDSEARPFTSGKGLMDMLLGEPEKPMIANHKIDCRCVKCKAARKRAA